MVIEFLYQPPYPMGGTDPDPEPGKLKIICGWCGKGLGEKDGKGVEGESHGICDDCLRRYFPLRYDKIKEVLEVENIEDIYKGKPGERR